MQEEHIIFVKSFRHKKTGKIIRASDCGKTAFPIKVKDKSATKSKSKKLS